MALFAPSESPAVVVREIDLTGGVPNVQSTTGAIVGNFRWGPVGERTLIANEAELVDNFASPLDNEIDFLSATQYLRYSSTLQVVREASDSATQAYSITSNFCNLNEFDQTWRFGVDSNGAYTFNDSDNVLTANNRTEFDQVQSSIAAESDSDGAGNTVKIQFLAKYPGRLGNGVRVAYLGMLSDSATWDGETPGAGEDSNFTYQNALRFEEWTYADNFDQKPGTSNYAAKKDIKSDEIHVAVIDEYGGFSGTPGTVLETFPNLSVLTDARNDEGQSIYVADVINENSKYFYWLNFDSDMDAKGAGKYGNNNTKMWLDHGDDSAREHRLNNGTNSTPLGTNDIIRGYDLFSDRDQVEVDFLIAPSMTTRTAQTTVVNDLVAKAQSTRKDCVVVASPCRNDIVGVVSDADKVANTVATANTFTRSSYLVMDNNFLKVYDKYNDKYVTIPAASSVAGIMAATDFNRAAWFSPAGGRRGQLLGITSIAYSPTKGQRDTLYKAGVNPIANIPGQGSILFGDKTMLGRVSAFDRINVRRLFLILERAIGRAAEQVLFEFNDEFTRAEFVNIVEPTLREVQGRRGITDFRVVCDETNNTPEVIDRNEFKADIFIKPARSINYVTLNFVAVRTGVDFEEVVGTV